MTLILSLLNSSLSHGSTSFCPRAGWRAISSNAAANSLAETVKSPRDCRFLIPTLPVSLKGQRGEHGRNDEATTESGNQGPPPPSMLQSSARVSGTQPYYQESRDCQESNVDKHKARA